MPSRIGVIVISAVYYTKGAENYSKNKPAQM